MSTDTPFTPETIEEQIAELQKLDPPLLETSNQQLIQQLQLLYQPYNDDTEHVQHAYGRILQRHNYMMTVAEPPTQKANSLLGTAKIAIVGLRINWLSFKRVSLIAAVLLIGAILSGTYGYNLIPKPSPNGLATSSTAPNSANINMGFEPQPLLYQNTLYVFTGNGLRAYSAQNGAFERTYPINDLNNPIIEDGILYASSSTSTFALQLSDGKLLWQMPISLATGPVYSNGSLYGATYIPKHAIYAIQASSGKILWQYGLRNNYDYPNTPIALQGKVFFSSSLQTSGTNDASIYSLNAVDGSLNWQKHIGNSFISNLKTDGTSLYVYNNGFIESFDANGDKSWSTHLTSIQEQEANIPVITNDILYVVSNKTIYSISIVNGIVLWDYQAVTGSLFGAISLDNNMIYFGPGYIPQSIFHQNFPCSIIALDTKGGNLVWQKQLSDQQEVLNPTASQGVVYLTYNNGGLRHDELSALSGADGHQLWINSLDKDS